MPDVHDHESLSFGDALFLYLEREGMPLHIASVAVFDGPIPLGAFTRFIASKLPLVPRYQQRVVAPPLNLGLPAWDYDPDFDVHNHIRQAVLKRGTDVEFKAVAAQILSSTLDRRRPLWELTLVRGLQGNRTGLVIRMHHCLADGLAGIGIMNALMDTSPVAPPIPKPAPIHPTPERRAAPALLDSLVTSCFSAVQQVLTAHSELLTVGQRMVAAAGKQPEQHATQLGGNGNSHQQLPFLDELGRLVPELAAPAERLPFNVICRGPQKFHWAEIPVAEIKAVKQACGTTFNDVALAAMTLAVRRYAESHDVQLRRRSLRIVVPVNVRGQNDVSVLGNRITFLPVSIPLDISKPEELLAAVCERMTHLKGAHLAELVGFAGTLLGTIPSALQALLGPIASQLPLSFCNLIFTNVCGPAEPLYLLGHKMLACYPYVPIGGEMGMNVAVLTYNGVAYFGFTGDVHAVPDLRRFEKLLTASFVDLKKAAGVPVQPKRIRKKSEPAVKPVSTAPAAPAAPEEPLPPPLTKTAVA
jgi:WS/DGAT/MGAT family acyltransferase